uniref:Uncharacterized protein n=1 Tax=viral metagenome TaxID=1070528 RepID=A0A6M3L1F8_9ZZZZ
MIVRTHKAAGTVGADGTAAARAQVVAGAYAGEVRALRVDDGGAIEQPQTRELLEEVVSQLRLVNLHLNAISELDINLEDV